MSDDVLLDHAAQLIADARVACLKLAVPPEEIAKIMMDEAILALMAERLSLSDIQAEFTIAVLWLPPHSNAALCSHAANPEHLLNAPGSFNIEDCGKFFCSCYRY